MTLPETRTVGGRSGEGHVGIREEEEEERESDLDLPAGLNPTPETLPAMTENVVEEHVEVKECEA